MTLRIGGFATRMRLRNARERLTPRVWLPTPIQPFTSVAKMSMRHAPSFVRVGSRPEKAGSVTDYGMKQISLKDPDGYEICFQQPVECGARRLIAPSQLTQRRFGASPFAEPAAAAGSRLSRLLAHGAPQTDALSFC